MKKAMSFSIAVVLVLLAHAQSPYNPPPVSPAVPVNPAYPVPPANPYLEPSTPPVPAIRDPNITNPNMNPVNPNLPPSYKTSPGGVTGMTPNESISPRYPIGATGSTGFIGSTGTTGPTGP